MTNALRHSQPRTCSIIGRRRDGMIVLEVVNDGAFGPMGEGSGLAGGHLTPSCLAAVIGRGRRIGG